jgi:hypothetical protein
MPRSFPILALLTLLSLATATDAQQWTAEKIIGELNKKRSRPTIVKMSIFEKHRVQDPDNPKKWIESTESGDATIDFPTGRYRFDKKKTEDGQTEHWTKLYDGKELKGRRWLTDKDGNRSEIEKEVVGIGTGQFRHDTFGIFDFPYFLMFGSILSESTQYYPGHLFFPLDAKLFHVDRVDALKGQYIVAVRTFPTGSNESRIFNEYLIDPNANYGVVKMTQYRSKKADTKKQKIFDLTITLQKAGTTFLPKNWSLTMFSGVDKEISRHDCIVNKIEEDLVDKPELFEIPIHENQKIVRREYTLNDNKDSSIVKSKETLTYIDGQLTSSDKSIIVRWIILCLSILAAVIAIVAIRNRKLHTITSNRKSPSNFQRSTDDA